MTIIARSSTATTEGVSSRASLPPRQGDIAARSLRVIRLADIDKEELIELERPAAISLASLRNGSIAFGDFRLLPSKRLLLKGASAVNIGARAFDVLVILAERAGEVVSAKEIESRAYSGLTVTDNALRFQIAALRKALGDGRDGKRYVITVTGRGYCFAAPVSRTQESQPRALAASNDNPLSAPERDRHPGPRPSDPRDFYRPARHRGNFLSRRSDSALRWTY